MRSSRVSLCFAGALTAGLLASGPALAQQVSQVALNRFEPAPAGDRMFGVESPFSAGEGVPHVALLFDYAHNPYTLLHGPGHADVGAVVSDQMFLHLSASVAILNRITLNFSVPAAVQQDGGDPTGVGLNGTTAVKYVSPHGPGFGDIRLGVRATLYGAYDDPFQIALSGYLWVPTGASNAYLSDGQVRGMPSLVMGGHFAPLNWSLSAGVQLRPHQTVDGLLNVNSGTNMQIGGGIGFLFADGRAQIGPEVKGSFVLSPISGRSTNADFLVDARYRIIDDLELGLGAGPGLASGFGTPDVRVVAMLAFSPMMKKPAPPDRDADGVPDAEDACPEVAAAREANPARPGCPAPVDRDGDGVSDDVDACPDVPGLASTDPNRNGCPMDRDGDGIPDTKDACPDQPGPPHADPAKNGCPPPRDSDGDGIPDAEDACPTIPGVRSTDPKLNGCPGDRDGDGIRDDLDACPDVRGVPSKDPKKNGCPRVAVTDKGIDILEQVDFATGTAKILPTSDALLEEIAGIFKKHPDIVRVEVQGHTDDQGNKAFNQQLSQQRATAVRTALVARGIAERRLVSKGYGSTQPIADNATEEGRARNRRVQFVILERAAARTEGAKPPPPKAPAAPKAPPPPPTKAPPAPKKK